MSRSRSEAFREDVSSSRSGPPPGRLLDPPPLRAPSLGLSTRDLRSARDRIRPIPDRVNGSAAAPSTLRDEATACLETLRQRAREGRSIGDDHLIQLAWESFAAGFAAGSAETDAAQTEAASPRDRRSMRSPMPRSLADLVAALSPRRLEVLRLVARGLTNREIADVLGISSNTVKAHLAGVLESLDLTNRTEAAAALRDYEEERAGSPD